MSNQYLNLTSDCMLFVAFVYAVAGVVAVRCIDAILTVVAVACGKTWPASRAALAVNTQGFDLVPVHPLNVVLNLLSFM